MATNQNVRPITSAFAQGIEIGQQNALVRERLESERLRQQEAQIAMRQTAEAIARSKIKYSQDELRWLADITNTTPEQRAVLYAKAAERGREELESIMGHYAKIRDIEQKPLRGSSWMTAEAANEAFQGLFPNQPAPFTPGTNIPASVFNAVVKEAGTGERAEAKEASRRTEFLKTLGYKYDVLDLERRKDEQKNMLDKMRFDLEQAYKNALIDARNRGLAIDEQKLELAKKRAEADIAYTNQKMAEISQKMALAMREGRLEDIEFASKLLNTIETNILDMMVGTGENAPAEVVAAARTAALIWYTKVQEGTSPEDAWKVLLIDHPELSPVTKRRLFWGTDVGKLREGLVADLNINPAEVRGPTGEVEATIEGIVSESIRVALQQTGGKTENIGDYLDELQIIKDAARAGVPGAQEALDNINSGEEITDATKKFYEALVKALENAAFQKAGD